MWISWRSSILPNGFENIRLNLGDAGFISCITKAEHLPRVALKWQRTSRRMGQERDTIMLRMPPGRRSLCASRTMLAVACVGSS